eukprot:8166979-Pyramimonas_sp.AAC.1
MRATSTTFVIQWRWLVVSSDAMNYVKLEDVFNCMMSAKYETTDQSSLYQELSPPFGHSQRERERELPVQIAKHCSAAFGRGTNDRSCTS